MMREVIAAWYIRAMRLFLVGAALLVAPLPLAGQRGPDKALVIAAARDVMQRARYATLVTLGDGGQPQSRIVDPLVADSAFTIWVGTNPLSRKVTEIRRDARVNLMYFDAKSSAYVSVAGRAEIVSDRAEKTRHWKAEWVPFYKTGATGGDFILIRIRPSRIEVVSPAHKLANDSLTWRPVSVAVP